MIALRSKELAFMSKPFAKRFLRKWKARVQVLILAPIDELLAILFSSNRWFAGIYYLILNWRFDQEHLAVLRGKAEYYKSLRNNSPTSPLLRRNIHRLEKGLVMIPRKDIFGEDYIWETVCTYERALKATKYEREELRWATDILREYFSNVGSTKEINRSRIKFEELDKYVANSLEAQSIQFKPYPLSDLEETSCIQYKELENLYRLRRSVRWFKGKQVSSQVLLKAINAAATAPSACNRQAYKFIIVTEPRKAASVAECAGGTAGFFHQIPAVIIVVGDLSAYPKGGDRHLIYIDASLASMQLMLALVTLGLSTCPINWPDSNRSERKIRKIVNLQPFQRIIMLIAVGYGKPSGMIPFSQKKQDYMIAEAHE